MHASRGPLHDFRFRHECGASARMVSRLLGQEGQVLLACLHGMDQHLVAAVEDEHNEFNEYSVLRGVDRVGGFDPVT